MGGNIAWTIRQADGTEFRMSRWTNIFPGVISTDFLEGNPQAFADAMKSWFDMKADWDANGPDGPFEHHMTPVYSPYPYGFKPDEYGFILTDFKTKTLISANHYTQFRTIWAMPWWWVDPDREEQYEDKIQEYQKLFESGRIVNLHKRDNRQPSKIDLPEARDFKDLVEKSAKIVNDTLVTFDVKPPEGWTFLDFNSDTSKGRQEAHQAVQQLGFDFSDEEFAGWVEWIAWPDKDDDEQ